MKRKWYMIKMLAKYMWHTIWCPNTMGVRHLTMDLAAEVQAFRRKMWASHV